MSTRTNDGRIELVSIRLLTGVILIPRDESERDNLLHFVCESETKIFGKGVPAIVESEVSIVFDRQRLIPAGGVSLNWLKGES